MKLIGIWVLGLGIAVVICSYKTIPTGSRKNPQVIVDSLKGNALKEDSLTPMEKTLRSVPKNAKPRFGYRFVIRGDFDGDGRQDTLTEHYFSLRYGEETNKYYDSLEDYDQQVAMAVNKVPYSFVSSNTRAIDTLSIWRGGQLFGLAYLKNEGDLDGDGADEISYVIDWADWSSINTGYLMSYKHHKWKELYHFDIWDWQIPQLPQFSTSFGLFGVGGIVSTMGNDTMNTRLQNDLDSWPGFIKKIGKNKIRVIYRNWASEMDTAIIDLRHIKKKKE